VTVIDDLELYEISVVGITSNASCGVSVAKSLCSSLGGVMEVKMADVVKNEDVVKLSDEEMKKKEEEEEKKKEKEEEKEKDFSEEQINIIKKITDKIIKEKIEEFNKPIKKSIQEENGAESINKNNDNVNSLIEQRGNLQKLIAEISENLSDEKDIKDVIINKYQTYGTTYLYTLCNSYNKNKDNELLKKSNKIALNVLEIDSYIKRIEIINIILDSHCNIKEINESIQKINLELAELYEKGNNEILNDNNLHSLLYQEYKKSILTELNDLKSTEIASIESKLQILKIYRQIVKPSNGIISIILASLVIDIENKVNYFLRFTNIVIRITDSYDVLFRIDNETWLDVSLLSGYQKFILSISFRLVLWQIADTILPDIFIIDEGFGMCDYENVELIGEFLKNLTESTGVPSIILIVSHLTYLNDLLEYSLIIKNNKIYDSYHVKFLYKNAVEEIKEDYKEEQEFQDIQRELLQEEKENISDIQEDYILNDKFYLDKLDISEIEDKQDNLADSYVIDKDEIKDSNFEMFETENTNCDIQYNMLMITEESKTFYCDICDLTVKNINKNKHLNSMKHKNKIPK